ncbi:hypothetical protein [Marinobacter algicola]|uniref:Reactivating factor for ethanolamine ammonia lyase n=1 Tax=Marinobacter algicola DG893 TaxID=443152 RepID=A6F041_9GAMM|nr:hypothetical protein [Marinobacter algicola]EDM47954.1 reactivating factor for ethanolamine ammonia lyase [Marinobacter algicola DG893]
MGNEKIVTISYKSADEAAAMAAKINAADRDGEVRVVSNGNALEVATANPLAADLLALFSWVSRSIAQLFRSSDDTSNGSSKGAVSA